MITKKQGSNFMYRLAVWADEGVKVGLGTVFTFVFSFLLQVPIMIKFQEGEFHFINGAIMLAPIVGFVLGILLEFLDGFIEHLSRKITNGEYVIKGSVENFIFGSGASIEERVSAFVMLGVFFSVIGFVLLCLFNFTSYAAMVVAIVGTFFVFYHALIFVCRKIYLWRKGKNVVD